MKKKKLILILFFTLMATAIICCINLGSDYFWHIRMGEYIVNFKALPKECIYSWYAIENGLMFTLHEWLYEIILYLLYLISHKFAPLIYQTIFVGLLCFFLYKTTIKKLLKKNPTLFIPFIVIATFVLSMYSLPRPHIISWLLVAIAVYLSYDFYESGSKNIYWFPLLSLIWGNIHGGSSCLSYMIPGLFMVLGLFNFNKYFITNKKLPKKKIITYIIIIVLNIFALLINPYGIEMVLYPYINILDNTMTSIINEWQTTKINSFIGIIAYAMIFYNLFIFYKSKKKIRLIDLSLFLVFVYLAISGYRFVPLMIITNFYTTLTYLPDSSQNIKGKFIVILLIIANIVIPLTQIIELDKKLSYQEVDDKLIETIKEMNPKRLYNDYNVGGYLIYNKIDVFIDGRADAYSKDNLLDADKIDTEDDKTIAGILNKYNFDLLITNNDDKLAEYLGKSNEYEFVIKDKNYCIYKKAEVLN